MAEFLPVLVPFAGFIAIMTTIGCCAGARIFSVLHQLSNRLTALEERPAHVTVPVAPYPYYPPPSYPTAPPA